MKTLKVISSVLVIGLLVGQASGDIYLTFEPSSQAVGLGSLVDVGLKITGLGAFRAPSLSTFDLDVTYNPAILSFSTAVYGNPGLGDQLDLDGLGPFTLTTVSSGRVNVVELSFDSVSALDSMQAPEFILAMLRFDALGVGMSPLGFSGAVLGDSWGDLLSANLGTGSVTVTPLPGAVLLGALGLGSAGWLLGRKR